MSEDNPTDEELYEMMKNKKKAVTGIWSQVSVGFSVLSMVLFLLLLFVLKEKLFTIGFALFVLLSITSILSFLYQYLKEKEGIKRLTTMMFLINILLLVSLIVLS